MKYNPIGTIFLNDVPHMPMVYLIVVPQVNNKPICNGCFYQTTKCRTCNAHACTPYLRKDKKHVIFVVTELKNK